MRLVAVDPGKWKQAVAVFCDGQLEHVGTTTISKATTMLYGESYSSQKTAARPISFWPVREPRFASYPVTLMVAWFDWAFTTGLSDVLTIVEKPDFLKFHGNEQARNLCDLSVVVGCIACGYEHAGAVVRLTEPREWKGNQSKDRTRDEVVAPFLASRGEIDIRDLTEDETDAIGIGLHFVERGPDDLVWRAHTKSRRKT